jgi:ring-1,2-phenylacetyl-CoA epoxidase subunit PaaE
MDSATVPHDALRQLQITAVREEVPGVKTFLLQPSDGAPYLYEAGQFITIVFRRRGIEERRSYSVSSAPAAGDPLAITVKRVENGAHSRWLIDHAQPGDVLTCTYAAGLFTLPRQPEAYGQIFLFAAGIGITPVYSLLKELLHRNEDIRIVLFYSNRSQADTVFYKELLDLESRSHGHLQVEWRFSDARNLLKARISKVILPQLIRQYQVASAEELFCYICGPEDYRWLLQMLLEEAGVPPDQIRREIFAAGRMPIPSLPPDTTAHKVTLKLPAQSYEMIVQYPETILSAAKQHGIHLPYSCEAGRCASCIARCTQGEVWMAYNEVLTEKDLANGLVLICTGYPIDGDVMITLK